MTQAISVAAIDPDPGQARKHFDPGRLAELADSMRADGLAVPVSVRPTGDRFTLVHGERRWRAATALGWETIPANVLDVDPEAARWLALAENVQRDDLTPIEEADAYRAMLAAGITQADLGRRIGKSQSYIAQKLRLGKLPRPIRVFLSRGAITEGHARLLLRFRAFYGGESTTFPPDSCGREDWGNPLHIQQFYAALRPLDGLLWMVTGTPRAAEMLREAAGAFMAEVRENGHTIPAWIVPASWFAALVVDQEVPVADLAGMIDTWEEFILSAVAHVFENVHADNNHDRPAGEREALLAGAYWGHRSDLRHARLGHWAEAPPDHIRLRAARMACDRGLTWPSDMVSENVRERLRMSRDMGPGVGTLLSDRERREQLAECEARIQSALDEARADFGELEGTIRELRRLLGPGFDAWMEARFGERWSGDVQDMLDMLSDSSPGPQSQEVGGGAP